MFAFVPALNDPMVTTPISVAAISRETMPCKRITVEAAMTTGSMVASGREPCPPDPYNVTRSESEAAYATPVRSPSIPAGRGDTCCPRQTSGRGTFAYNPSATIEAAPCTVSSDG